MSTNKDKYYIVTSEVVVRAPNKADARVAARKADQKQWVDQITASEAKELLARP